jgi:hypothetical protein
LIAVGVAHAYQYVLVTVCMDARRRASAPRVWFLPLTLVTMIYLVAFFVMNRIDLPDLTRPLAVLWNSIIMWHFIIDADVWRLSRSFQRQAVRESMLFLLRYLYATIGVTGLQLICVQRDASCARDTYAVAAGTLRSSVER